MPRVLPMNDFIELVTERTGLSIATPVEALFILYHSYCQAMGNVASGFDKFAFWGNILLKDFGDIDMNLADASQLFTNLSELREISTNYISDELSRDIYRLLGISVTPSSDDAPFWNHYNGDSDMQLDIKTLWGNLPQIYAGFGTMLEQRGLTTLPKLYRKALEIIEEKGISEFYTAKIAFIGLDLLNLCETLMFKRLQNQKLADFWWDNVADTLACEENPGHELIDTYAKMFPAPVSLQEVNGHPEVTVYDVSSAVGQTKCVLNELNCKTNADGKQNTDAQKVDSNAIVLSDEALLEPLLNSQPEGGLQLNISMGYQLRRSSICTLMYLVSRAHHRSTVRRDGQCMFYREDINDFLSHPIIKSVFTDDVLRINNVILTQNEYNVSQSVLQSAAFGCLFNTVNGMTDVERIKAYVKQLMDFCANLFDELVKKSAHDDSNKDSANKPNMTLQSAFVQQYIAVLRQLYAALDNIGLPVNSETIFFLVDKMVYSTVLPFTGKHQNGCQVLGMLETRALDFDHVYILSANEGVLSRRNTISSFIPDRFRKAYGLHTADLLDAAMTYRFYRLIARAEKVSLYYNSANDAKGEPSRYIEQLVKIYGWNVRWVKMTSVMNVAKELAISVPKTGIDMAEMYQNGNPETDKNVKTLSASSIKEYIHCPLKFYFHHIEHLSDDNAPSDFMDAGTFGTIVHDTLQQFYYPDAVNGKRKTVFYKSDILQFITNGLKDSINRNINRCFLKRDYAHLNDPVTGHAVVLFDTIYKFVHNALMRDITLMGNDGSLTVVECEVSHNLSLKLNNTEVNFTFKPDRVDKVNGELRIIDYKTGKDVTKFSDVDDLFDTNEHDDVKAILQLFLYAIAYHQLNPDCGPIKIEIYKLNKIEESGVSYDKQPAVLYNNTPESNELLKGVTDELEMLIKDMMSPESKFCQTAKPKHCEYCNFKEFCRR
ncbi:MAG: PD-(D/E)XK nuclease family protein [Bacteroidales bacterium]|nr:PD-(D/E)XK nuclease family protein [Candidatus Sodaliphilus aphodohippi]